MITNRNPIFRRFAWIGVALALLAAPLVAFAQDEGDKQQFQLDEKVGDALQKLKPLQDAKDYKGMLALVDQQLASVKPTSYDAAYLLDIKAKIYLQLDQLSGAIEPWRQVLKLSEQYGYKDEKERLEIMKFLGQLIFMEATTVKEKNRQQQLVEQAGGYLKSYLAKNPKPESEMQMLYANILFSEATVDESRVNEQKLREARTLIEKGMLNEIRPKEGFYMLMLAVLQQQNDYIHSAEYMELLLQQYPNKKDIWSALFGTYVNLANNAKGDSKEQRNYFVRAINTVERAQKLGFMNTPRDNYNLFTVYLNAGYIIEACDLLYKGMKSGAIESSQTNWRILGAYYQQANKDLQAIAVLKEATKLFPHDGGLDLLIGQFYQQMDKIKDAHDAYARAVKKGNLGEHPHQAWLYLAYTSLEIEDYQGALNAIAEAAKLPDGAKDPQVKSLKAGIEATIQEREAQKNAAKKL